MFARLCREAVLKQAGEEAPVVTTELQIYTVPSDAFLYVAREFKAPKGHTVQVSEPIDLSKDVYRADARKHRMLDEQALLQAVTKACNNVPGGKIYRAQLNGMRNDEPQSALLKITDL